jgi:predicted dehydrogenase
VDFKEPSDFEEYQLSYRTGDILAPKISGVEPLYLEAQHFVQSIIEGQTPVTSGEQGLQVVSSLEAAEASMRAGGVETPIDTPS